MATVVTAHSQNVASLRNCKLFHDKTHSDAVLKTDEIAMSVRACAEPLNDKYYEIVRFCVHSADDDFTFELPWWSYAGLTEAEKERFFNLFAEIPFEDAKSIVLALHSTKTVKRKSIDALHSVRSILSQDFKHKEIQLSFLIGGLSFYSDFVITDDFSRLLLSFEDDIYKDFNPYNRTFLNSLFLQKYPSASKVYLSYIVFNWIFSRDLSRTLKECFESKPVFHPFSHYVSQTSEIFYTWSLAIQLINNLYEVYCLQASSDDLVSLLGDSVTLGESQQKYFVENFPDFVNLSLFEFLAFKELNMIQDVKNFRNSSMSPSLSFPRGFEHSAMHLATAHAMQKGVERYDEAVSYMKNNLDDFHYEISDNLMCVFDESFANLVVSWGKYCQDESYVPFTLYYSLHSENRDSVDVVLSS